MHDFGKHGGFVILDLLLPTYCVGWILQDDPLTANCHRLTWVETNSNMLIMYENMTEARDPISKTSPRAVCCALWVGSCLDQGIGHVRIWKSSNSIWERLACLGQRRNWKEHGKRTKE
jgi:hypothetical protein